MVFWEKWQVIWPDARYACLVKIRVITMMLRGVLELLHTHLVFIFPKVFPFLLFIISHYLVSYILGENIPTREYSLSVETSV